MNNLLKLLNEMRLSIETSNETFSEEDNKQRQPISLNRFELLWRPDEFMS